MAYVDQDLCISCGMCVNLVPDVFAFNDEDKAECITEVTAELQDSVEEAAEGCPVDAIKLDD